MKELKRENVVVSFLGTDPKEVLAVLDSAGEKVYDSTREYIANGDMLPSRYFFWDGDDWQTRGDELSNCRVTITIDQLASMFGQYKYQIGDKVKCVNISDPKTYKGAAWEEGKEFVIHRLTQDDTIAWASSGCGVFTFALQLVEKAGMAVESVGSILLEDSNSKPNKKKPTTKAPSRTISREALGEIYPHVCQDWKDHIDSMLEAKDFKFSDSISVNEDFIKRAYEAASKTIHEEWLNKYLPPLKIKKEVEIKKWCLVDPKTFKVLNSFVSHQAADDHESLPQYKGSQVVELRGTITIEEDDPDYTFLPF